MKPGPMTYSEEKLLIFFGQVKAFFFYLMYVHLDFKQLSAHFPPVTDFKLQSACRCWVKGCCGQQIGTLRSNDATATRTSLKKLICMLSVFIAIIPNHLLCQM